MIYAILYKVLSLTVAQKPDLQQKHVVSIAKVLIGNMEKYEI